MSINHFSSNFNPLWTTSQQHHQQELLQPFFMETTTTTATSNNLNRHDNDDEDNDNDNTGTQQRHPSLDREPMFEKPLTPSDVGKLNRLVIPKQHAEKYFPLQDSSGGGGGGGDKGMLLSFEDESGRCWRFRYSYWSSSQSYVLTKGWSKYVKDKRLDAGDVVSFERLRHGLRRHQSDGAKLFIGWRRRGGAEAAAAAQDSGGVDMSSVGASVVNGGWTSGFYNTHHTYPAHLHQVHHIPSGQVVQNQTMPVGNSRRLRLFGVNLEFQAADDGSEAYAPEGSSLSTHPDPMHQQFYF